MGKKQDKPADATPRRSRLRWLRKPVVWVATLVLLVASIAIAIELILRSDLPRQIVISQAEQMTGLRVEIDHLRSHWDGSTDIRGFRVGLPLAGDDLLSAPHIEVRHAMPLMVLFGLGIESIVVDSPSVSVRQDAAGRWNVQEAAALMFASSSDTPGGPMTGLPAIGITDARLDIVDNRQRVIALDDLSLQGQPTSGAGWTFRVSLDATGQRTLSGQLVTGGRFTHDLAFSIEDPLKIIEPYFGGDLPASSLKGHWNGTLSGGHLAGTLTLDEVRLADAVAKGDVGVKVSADGGTLSPRGFTVAHAALPGGSASIDGGGIAFDGNVVTLRNLSGRGVGGGLRASGRFDIAQQSGDANVMLDGLSYSGVTIDAGLNAALTHRRAGEYELTLDAVTTGRFAQLGWRTDAALQMRGSDIHDITWTARLNSARITQEQTSVDVSEASARGSLSWPQLTLDDSTIKSFVTLQTKGGIDFSSMTWELAASSTDVPLRNPYDDQAMPQLHSLAVRVEGVGRSMTISQGRIDGPRMRMRFSGGFADNGVQPLRLDIQGDTEPLRIVMPWGAELRTGASRIGMKIDGALNPMLIGMRGELVADQLWYDDRSIGRVVIPVEGALVPSGQLTVSSRDVRLFDGSLNLEATAQLTTGDVVVTLNGERIALERVDALLAESQQLEGTASIEEIRLTVPKGDVAALAIEGDVRVNGLAARGLQLGDLVSRIEATRDALSLADLKLTDGAGTIEGTVRTELASGLPTEVELLLDAWPARWPGVDALATVDGKVSAAVGAAGLNAADLAVDARLNVADRDMGRVRFDAAYAERRVRLTNLSGDLFGGQVTGQAEIVLDEPLHSSGRFAWQDISLPDAVAVLPQLHLLRDHGDLRGRVSGTATIGTSLDRRAKDAAEVRITIEPRDASMRGIRFNTASATAFIWPERVVIDTAKVELERGSVSAWGRATKRGDDMDIFMRASLTALDVAPLLAAVSTDAEPMPGILTGDLTLHLPPSGMSHADGSANLTITESDLARLGPLTALYNAMNMDLLRSAEPRGEGHLVARIEGGDLYLAEMRYVNRGAHARASGVVRDIRNARDSQINIVAIGSWQPLPRLLMLADVDNAIRSIQQNLAAVRVQGTVGEPRASQLTADNMLRMLKSVLISESAETSEPAP